MIKMLNKNGHPFEALEANVEAYKRQGATLETEKNTAKPKKAKKD